MITEPPCPWSEREPGTGVGFIPSWFAAGWVFTGGVPQHTPSAEATWLADHYADLAATTDHAGVSLDGQWIAVVGQDIVDNDRDPAALVVRVNAAWGQGVALFASVRSDRLA